MNKQELQQIRKRCEAHLELMAAHVAGTPLSPFAWESLGQFEQSARQDIPTLLDEIDRLAPLEDENVKLLETCLAAGFLGNGTQIVGDTRYKQLCDAEDENKRLRGALKKYGDHAAGCPCNWPDGPNECDCGFVDILAPKENNEEET